MDQLIGAYQSSIKRGPLDCLELRLGEGEISKAPARRNSSSETSGPLRTFSKRLAWTGSSSTSQPRTLRTLISSVLYSASQWSG